MKTYKFTQEYFQSLGDRYVKSIEYAFDALERVQNATKELTDYFNEQKTITNRKCSVNFGIFMDDESIYKLDTLLSEKNEKRGGA